MVEFDGGRVKRIEAAANGGILEAYAARDEGASRLGEIGLLFVDGYHSQEQARFDFRAFEKLLAPRGIALFHDSMVRRQSEIYGAGRAYGIRVRDFLDELKRAFRPEFINRIDDIIVFHALSREHITAIVQLMVDRINKQLSDKGIQLEPTGAAMDMLVQKGYDPTYGARQLRRTIQKYVEDPLAEAIVRGQFGEGARIEVDIESGNFTFREIQIAEPRLALAER